MRRWRRALRRQWCQGAILRTEPTWLALRLPWLLIDHQHCAFEFLLRGWPLQCEAALQAVLRIFRILGAAIWTKQAKYLHPRRENSRRRADATGFLAAGSSNFAFSPAIRATNARESTQQVPVTACTNCRAAIGRSSSAAGRSPLTLELIRH
jgi:hypothetical protein